MLCFIDQRESLQQQLDKFLDAETANSWSSSFSSSSSGSLASDGSLASGLPQGSRLAYFLQHLDVEKTFGYYVFLFMMAFTVAALVEEYLKLWIVQGTCCCAPSSRLGRGGKRGWLCHPSRLLFHHQKHSSHSFVIFMAVIAGALGFSFTENVAYTFTQPTFGDQVVTAVVRGLVSTSLHCICGGITGVQLARRLQKSAGAKSSTTATKLSPAADLAKWSTKLTLIRPAVLIHGMFDVQVFLLASLASEDVAIRNPVIYGLVVPAVVALVILIASFCYLRRSVHGMEHRMHEGRYIQVAVDLESGRRVGLDDDDDDIDEDDFENDVEDFSRGTQKTRAVFNI